MKLREPLGSVLVNTEDPLPSPIHDPMPRLRFLLIAGLPALFLLGTALEAQDVEILGEHHGTRPPDAYYDELARDPDAFQFQREGLDRLLHMQRMRGASFSDLLRLDVQPVRSLGPRNLPMLGTFRFPLVLGLFADSPDSEFDGDRVQQEYFDGPNSYHQTVTGLYQEMSGGRVELDGTTFPWVRTGLDRSQVTLGSSGLSSSGTEGVGAFVEEIVMELDAQGVDWSQFDNTGDGFVDVLSIMHPTSGAECGGGEDRVWSHRWNLRSATQRRLDPGIETSTPRPDGEGFIYINDYTIQPVLACNGEEINQIGVFAHELGHGFGLPDLYGTGGSGIRGAGRWDLMGTGTWGCRGEDPSRPCHLGAWSKAVLGWVDVEDLELDRDHGIVRLPPVQSAGRILRIGAADESGQFLLLENRQRMGSEANLWEPGLLIWHVDPVVLESRWPANRVNADPVRLGVWLRQADGLNELATGGASHGNPGDPFPGCILDEYFSDYPANAGPCLERNREFHFGTEPASRTHEGTALGATLTGIELVGGVPHDVRFGLSTRMTRITLAAEGASGPQEGSLFRVDGDALAGGGDVVEAAPYQTLELEAPPGEEIEEGVRVGFAGWADGAPRIREFTASKRDTTLVASYGGEEVEVRWEPVADGGTIPPGVLETDPGPPDLWFPRGTQVQMAARARPGFAFVEWTGALAGRDNPTVIQLDGPVAVRASFLFEFAVTGVPTELEIPAAEPAQIELEVTSGADPISWALIEGGLPDGMEFRGGSIGDGEISGVPMATGRFPLVVMARDDQGLEATASLVLVVGPPAVGMDDLLSSFLGMGQRLTAAQREFFDEHGNRNGRFDVGDVRRFLAAYPDFSAPAAARLPRPASLTTEDGDMVIRLSFPDRSQEEDGS